LEKFTHYSLITNLLDQRSHFKEKPLKLSNAIESVTDKPRTVILINSQNDE